MPSETRVLETLNLPTLEVKPIKRSIGKIRHVLKAGGQYTIDKVEEVEIAGLGKLPLYSLGDGEKVIVLSKKKKVEPPADVDGVLFQSPTDEISWISHKLLQKFDRTAAKGGSDIDRDIREGWKVNFQFRSEVKDQDGNVTTPGLRPPQIGALHAIGSHWSLYKNPATIVMPTGTGKTETMLASLVAYPTGKLLIVVPSKVLRDQTVRKFLGLGLLRTLGNLGQKAKNPIVGVILNRPASEDDLEIVRESQVIITTVSALIGERNESVLAKLASQIDTLIVDEAHHLAAATWTQLRTLFEDKAILQFTATPYRRDGKLVDGKVIYEYPLGTAQRDGYFKKISFTPVYEIDQETGDESIAVEAIKQLKRDIGDGFDHLVMARCATKERAGIIHEIYSRLGPEFKPVVVHSDEKGAKENLEKLKRLESRIVVCVDMLGEGFDLPQLKIAAIHDTHKSLAVLLQFTGRFTRTSGASLGEATVITNISDPNVSSALERLYSEDADWNKLLSEFSSEASKAHKELTEFLNSSERLDDDGDKRIEISHHLLTPPLSTLFYEASSFNPKNFHKGLSSSLHVEAVWEHKASNTLYFVTRTQPVIRWTRSRDLRDRQWDLYILHFDPKNKILYLASSDKTSAHESLAKAVGAGSQISGDVIFRSLGGMNRLVFQNLGVRKHGRRNLRYALYTGADVAEALTLAEKAGSVKSNLSGNGWEGGEPVSIGCSYKGRVWLPDTGTIPEFISWSECVGGKIRDDSIDTTKIIENVLIPEEVEGLPDKQPLSIEWPAEILRQSEERVVLVKDDAELHLSECELALTSYDVKKSSYQFSVFNDPATPFAHLTLAVGGAGGYTVSTNSPGAVSVRIGKVQVSIEEYFSSYPPMLRFVDLSELDGNLLISPRNQQELEFPDERFEVWDWRGIDLSVESIWRKGVKRANSIQEHVAQSYINGGFDFIFDDDDPGEAADLVCITEEEDHIRLALVHCKFTTGKTSGERISDVVEVASQAIRSSKWKYKFKELGRHLINREDKTQKATKGRPTRILKGSLMDINRYSKLHRFKEVRAEIVIVQPGLSKARCTTDQKAVLGAAHNFLKETVGVDLDMICSK